MQLDPNTGDLFTDQGVFLKRMHCPLDKSWSDLSTTDSPRVRHCGNCSNTVHDTAAMTDHDLVELLRQNPHACLKVTYTQPNCTLRSS
ncbi:MAG: hypothetical protein EOP88_17735 [Verrucomicrobiaceae bacterium]|nr:MAG: hypothetical protein EOP88_17735 [Verrucomicrobiaceae bacterium]